MGDDVIVAAWRDLGFTRRVFDLPLVDVPGVAGFVYTELFLLRTIWPLCIATHLAGLAIFALSANILRSRYVPFFTEAPPEERYAPVVFPQ